MLKKVIIIILGIGAFGAFVFKAGVKYGVEGTAKVYGEGLSKSILSLDVNETSPEYHFDSGEFGIDDNGEAYYVITRTK